MIGVMCTHKSDDEMSGSLDPGSHLSVMVIISVLASSAVDRGFEPRSGQIKDHKVGICCFSAKHTALRRKSKDWLARNQNNVSECGDMAIRALLFQ